MCWKICHAKKLQYLDECIYESVSNVPAKWMIYKSNLRKWLESKRISSEIGDEIAKLEQLVEGNKIKIEAAQKTKNDLLMTLADSWKWNKQQRRSVKFKGVVFHIKTQIWHFYDIVMHQSWKIQTRIATFIELLHRRRERKKRSQILGSMDTKTKVYGFWTCCWSLA